MNFMKPVAGCLCTEIASGVCASPEVLSGKRAGRHAVTITAVSTCYIGDENVEDGKGIKLEAGENITIPTATSTFEQVYTTGACVITEWF